MDQRCSRMQPKEPTLATPALILPKEGCSLTQNVDFGLPLGYEKPCQCTLNLEITPVINLVIFF